MAQAREQYVALVEAVDRSAESAKPWFLGAYRVAI